MLVHEIFRGEGSRKMVLMAGGSSSTVNSGAMAVMGVASAGWACIRSSWSNHSSRLPRR